MNQHSHAPNYTKYVIFASEGGRDALIERTRFDGPDGCWEFTGSLNEAGYGFIATNRHGKIYAHRLALHICGRPVPADRTVDHLCRNRKCVNPAHLDIVTPAENTLRGNGYFAINARKTHCINGHEFTPENVYVGIGRKTGRPTRTCKTCVHKRNAARAAA